MSWFWSSPSPSPSPSPLATSAPASVFPYSTRWQAFWEIFQSFAVYILLTIFVIWIAYSYSKNSMDKKIMGGCGCGSSKLFSKR